MKKLSEYVFIYSYNLQLISKSIRLQYRNKYICFAFVSCSVNQIVCSAVWQRFVRLSWTVCAKTTLSAANILIPMPWSQISSYLNSHKSSEIQGTTQQNASSIEYRALCGLATAVLASRYVVWLVRFWWKGTVWDFTRTAKRCWFTFQFWIISFWKLVGSSCWRHRRTTAVSLENRNGRNLGM